MLIYCHSLLVNIESIKQTKVNSDVSTDVALKCPLHNFQSYSAWLNNSLESMILLLVFGSGIYLVRPLGETVE